MGCGRTMAGARCQDAVQTIDYRLTGISEPCGCRCRGDQSGSCARSREHRAMRLRASSGLTQPAWKTIRCPAIRCTMAKRYSCALRESPDSRLRPSHDCTSSPETTRESAPDPRWSFGQDRINCGARNVSSANELALASLRQAAYPPPRFACVIGAARAPVDKS